MEKIGRKWVNDGFSGNTPIFFYFHQKTPVSMKPPLVSGSYRKKHVKPPIFVRVSLKPSTKRSEVSPLNLWWFHWNRGFLVELEALQRQTACGPKRAKNTEKRAPLRASGPARRKASNSAKNPRFQWNRHRFQVLNPKDTWNRRFSSEFHWNRQQKEVRFPP